VTSATTKSHDGAPALGDATVRTAPPVEPFRDGARVFGEVKDALIARYYRDGLHEDDLYRAATQGMLEHADSEMAKWNKLLSPAEYADLRADLKGEVVGVGVQIDFEAATGHAKVVRIIAASPAERAGLVVGDLIVAVDGIVFKDKSLRDVLAQIRGKVGEKVSLTVLRGQELVSIAVPREVVSFDPVKHLVLGDGVGYLRIRAFSQKTAGMARTALETLQKAGVSALVIDLRSNPGGALDEAVATAGLLLPKGSGIVTVQTRGQAPKAMTASGGGPLLDRPLVVLINENTGSSAEFIAAALSEARHATLVGETTMGKWTVQTLDELRNGYAVKYTVGLLRTPSGRTFEGVGLTPDAEVSMDDKQIEKAERIDEPAERLAADVQLRTGIALVRARR
jgi:carboxyl-terminal processing protease